MIFYIHVFLPTTGDVSSIGQGNLGFKDGVAEEAQFNYPSGISVSESDGSLFICDTNNHKIRKITFKGISYCSLLQCASIQFISRW